MTDTDHPEPDPRYRKNVGLVVFNGLGRVWLGRRQGQPGPANWQFPQGGVDAGETLEAAARRELQEETGMTSVQTLARIPGWISYDFPEHVLRSGRGRGFIGQAQAWFRLPLRRRGARDRHRRRPAPRVRRLALGQSGRSDGDGGAVQARSLRAGAGGVPDADPRLGASQVARPLTLPLPQGERGWSSFSPCGRRNGPAARDAPWEG